MPQKDWGVHTVGGVQASWSHCPVSDSAKRWWVFSHGETSTAGSSLIGWKARWSEVIRIQWFLPHSPSSGILCCLPARKIRAEPWYCLSSAEPSRWQLLSQWAQEGTGEIYEWVNSLPVYSPVNSPSLWALSACGRSSQSPPLCRALESHNPPFPGINVSVDSQNAFQQNFWDVSRRSPQEWRLLVLFVGEVQYSWKLGTEGCGYPFFLQWPLWRGFVSWWGHIPQLPIRSRGCLDHSTRWLCAGSTGPH